MSAAVRRPDLHHAPGGRGGPDHGPVPGPRWAGRSARNEQSCERRPGATDKRMSLPELLDTLKGLGAKLALHNSDTITVEPPGVLTPALSAALAEHHAALVAFIRSGPSSPSSFDVLLIALDGLD